MQELNAQQRQIIMESSVTPEQILANLDALNEEIVDSIEAAHGKGDEYQEALKNLSDSGATALQQPTEPQVEMETGMEEDMDAQLAAEAARAEAQLEALQAAKAKAAEEAAQEQEQVEAELSPEDQQKEAILSLMRSIPNGPSEAQINALKQQYGERGLHVLAMSQDDVYIFTYLRRGQWQSIQKVVQAAAASDVANNPEEMLKEKVIHYCVKWPKGVASPEFLYNSRAGTIDSLYQAILVNSNFFNPQQVMMLTAQL